MATLMLCHNVSFIRCCKLQSDGAIDLIFRIIRHQVDVTNHQAQDKLGYSSKICFSEKELTKNCVSILKKRVKLFENN